MTRLRWYQANISSYFLLVLFIALVSVTFFIPVISSQLPHFYRSLFIIILCSVALIWFCLKEKVTWNNTFLLFVPFLLLWIIQNISFDNPFVETDRLLHLSYFLLALISVVVFASMRAELSNRSVMGIYSNLFLVASLTYSALMILEIAGFHVMQLFYDADVNILNTGYKGRASGLLGQPNQSGCLVALSLPVLIYLSEKNKLKLILVFICSFVLSLAIAYSGSRAAILEAASAYFLISVYASFHKDSALIRIAGLCIISSLLALLLSDQLATLLAKFGQMLGWVVPESLRAYPGLEVDGRLWLFAASAQLGIQNPILGVGQSGYMNGLLAIALQDHTFNDILISKPSAEHAHNLFLHLFATYGITGLFFALAGSIWAAVRVLKSLQKKSSERLVCASSLAILFVYSNLEFPLWTFYFLWLFVFHCVPFFKSVPLEKNWLRAVKFRVFAPVILLFVFVLYVPNLLTEYCTILPAKRAIGGCTTNDRELTMNVGFLKPYAILVNFLDDSEKVSSPSPEVISEMRDWRPVPLLMYADFHARLLNGETENAREKWYEFVHAYALTSNFNTGLVKKQLELDGIHPKYPEFWEYAGAYRKKLTTTAN